MVNDKRVAKDLAEAILSFEILIDNLAEISKGSVFVHGKVCNNL
jgi:hypothetical protein